jgi:UDP-N-acetylglucosamine--N-acetylmuramyl-(pentapeptide) pyrophosphoryl-undecaprenol N-acetylglucosamine transferase
MTGGGTGGHITPLLAVAREINNKFPEIKIFYVGERGGRFSHLAGDSQLFTSIKLIFAGKFRRYHNESIIRRLIDIKTNLQNLRDLLYVAIGVIQALILLKKLKPSVVFLKGGYVSVPVGIGCQILRIPYITHDSDVIPGLANRVLSSKAIWNATGFPAEFYSYNKQKIKFVGVPSEASFIKVDENLKNHYRDEINLPRSAQLVYVTGASQGSMQINNVMAKIVPKLLEENADLYVIHQTGKKVDYNGYTNNRLRTEEFSSDLYRKTGAADLVIARASMTVIAELAIQAKPTIVIPSPFLSNGHQLKNADLLKKVNAAVVLQESNLLANPYLLEKEILKLLSDKKMARELENNIHKLAQHDASSKLAELIISTAHGVSL